MRAVIACGSRDWTDAAMLRGTLAAVHAELGAEEWMLLIEGRAPGADRLAGAWADEMLGQRVGHARFPAAWTHHGKAAGPIRNAHMLAHLLRFRGEGAGVEVIAFHDDIDRPRCGTRDMLAKAERAEVPVLVISH